MKKTLSILFIALANFVILAHAVVPHHHHHDDFAICMDLFDCNHDHDKKSDNHPNTNKQKDDCPENCFNKNVFLLATHLSKQSIDLELDLTNNCPKDSFIDLDYKFTFFEQKSSFLLFELFHDFAQLQQAFSLPYSGLRAPPLV